MSEFADYPQGDPIPEAPGHVAGSETSAEAADSIDAGTMRRRVEACMRAAPDGTTDDELEVLLGMAHQSASPRRRELELMGRVVGTGCKRPTRSGRKAQIYVHVDNASPKLLRTLRMPPPRVQLNAEQREALITLTDALAEARALGLLETEIGAMEAAIAELLQRARPILREWQIVKWPPAA